MSDQNILQLRRQQPFSLALVGIFFLLLGFDWITKFWVHDHLPLAEAGTFAYPYGGIGVFKNWLGIQFSINYVANTGAAWGLFSDYPFVLVLLRVVLVNMIGCFVLLCNQKKSWDAPLMLILVGASGNILDFFIYGSVVDMFHFVFWGYDFPVFNVADACISIGIAWIFLLTCFEPDYE